MANLFDSIQQTAQGVVANTMGYDASWTPSDGGPTQFGRVLFKRPTEKEMLLDMEYKAVSPKIEYFAGIFPGLFESVRANNVETIRIDGVDYTCFNSGDLKFDGKTIIINVDNA